MIEMAAEDESFAAEVPDEVAPLETMVETLKLKALLNGRHDAAGAIIVDQRPRRRHRCQRLGRNAAADVHALGAEERLLGRTARAARQRAGRHQPRRDRRSAARWPTAISAARPGMHRLVRISPFNAEGKRQTSFAAIDVSPEVADSVDVEIDPEDVREDVFRAQRRRRSARQQNLERDPADPLPTNIVVQCQSERSQHKNRATAWKMLRARMARAEEEKREAAEAAKYQQQAKVGFGSQIRNYFLHPDQRVKDARTKYQHGQLPQRARRRHPRLPGLRAPLARRSTRCRRR